MSDRPATEGNKARWRRFIFPAVVVAGAAIYLGWNPVPSCTSAQTMDLLSKILTDQLKLGPNLRFKNIRVESGNVFSKRFECDADVIGIVETADATAAAKLFGIRLTGVHYTSERTEDTGAQYVTARMTPVAAPALAP